MKQPTDKSIRQIQHLVETYTKKTGTTTHPNPEVTEAVLLGLAHHKDELKKPLCPCRFYPDKSEEIKQRTWICPCDDMENYKYCHCLLFVRDDGLPITEHLPADHEGRQIYGITQDPTPNLGRLPRRQLEEREQHERPS